MNNLIKKLSFFLLLVFSVSINFSQTVTKTEKPAETLKIITYNIWNGFDFGKDEKRRAELVNWVNEQDPAIVGLQELCNYSPEKLKEDAKNWKHDYSVLLKTTGYSVGLTSKYPIEIKEKIFEGMHHGALHCKTGGIDVFVVHFSPSSFKKRREEAKIILQKLAEAATTNSNYMVLGDINAHSPFDAELYKNDVLLNRLRNSNADNQNNGNLADNELDFATISGFIAFPLIDVCQKYTSGMSERGSFPARSLAEENNETVEELINRFERIDYILVSPEMAKKCVVSKVYNGKENWYLSDHYPVMAEFDLSK
jgi:endonuclease/exonuclease/phosphatase family metal-dependent hydrolase